MEPLPLGEISATPWSFHPLWFVLLAVAVPAAAWLVFAWRRAFEEDPQRLRRSGVREMQRLLKGIRRSRSSPQSRHLHAWMRATARTWGVRASAPTSREVTQAVQAITSDAAVTSEWRTLWKETERGLFAADAAPPRDWLEQATSAAAEVKMPAREQRFPNRRRHWLPSVAVAAALAASGMTPRAVKAELPAQPAEAAVLAPEIDAQARQAAQKALELNWNDWAAHHNVALGQMQEANWNAAIAHATASFLQNPSSPATRDTLLVALGQTASADPHLRRMLSGMWYERVPALLSAAGWQRLAFVSGLLAAAGLTTMVLALYLPNRRALTVAGRSGFAAGVLAFAAATASWDAYGELSRPEAAILTQNVNLSPAPTDLVPTEETSPFAAGTVVRTHRSFLGWQQVSVGGKTLGWIRRNAVLPFYEKRS
jgi:hypothetical protein